MTGAVNQTENSVPGSDNVVASRIDELLNQLGKDKAVQVTGRSWKSLTRYADGMEPPFSVVAALAHAAGKPLDWLIDEAAHVPAAFQSAPMGFNIGDDVRDFTLVPRVGVSASAGYGLTALAEEITERLAFKTDWLREMGVTPQYAGLLTAAGDSMLPAIPDGSLLLVDLNPDQQIRSGCFYVIVLDGDLLVKRIDRRVDGTIDLVSLNPDFPKETIDAQNLDKLSIPGRVVWVGHKL